MSLLDAITSSETGMSAQSLRMNTVASNLANINTTSSVEKNAFHAKLPVFKTIMLDQKTGAQGVQMLKVIDDKTAVEKRYDPGNPQAGKDGYVYGTNVNRIEQLTDMISASQSYQADVEVANTCKQIEMKMIDAIKD